MTDAAAVQAVIDASAPGDVVTLPSGTFDAARTVLLRDRRTYLGYGCTIRQSPGANLDAVVASDAAASMTSTTFNTGLNLLGLRVDGARASQTSGAGIGLLLAVGRSKISDVFVTKTRADGLVMTDVNAAGRQLTDANTAVENTVRDCLVMDIAGCGIWVRQSGTNRLTDGVMVNNHVGFTRHDGIRIDAACGWLVDGNHVYAAGLSGIVTRYSYATRVVNNYVEGVGSLSETGLSTATAVDSPAPLWDVSTAYALGQVVTYGAGIYISNVDGNMDEPTTSPAWRAYITGGNSVGGVVALACYPGRPLLVAHNQVSLGHVTAPLQQLWMYRGYLLQGPETGGRGTAAFVHNDAVNELQPAGGNTTAFRLAPGGGGLTVFSERGNTARGAWTTVRSADPATGPTVSTGPQLGYSSTSASILGGDMCGTVTMTAGPGAQPGMLAAVSFSTTMAPVIPRVFLQPRDAGAAGLDLYVRTGSSGWSIRAGRYATSGQTYQVDYVVEA